MIVESRIEDGSTDLIVVSSCANMPQSCKGRYRRVAILRVPRGHVPAMISKRAIGVLKIIACWERLSCGRLARSGSRNAFAVALTDAAEIVRDLVSERVIA